MKTFICTFLLAVSMAWAQQPIQFSFGEKDFGTIKVGTQKASTFDLINYGNDTITVNLLITGEQSASNYDYGTFSFGGTVRMLDTALTVTLGPQDTLLGLPLNFYGFSPGEKRATLSAMYNGMINRASLVGTVGDSSGNTISLTPDDFALTFVNVAVGTSEKQYATFKNSGNVQVIITDLSGPTHEEFVQGSDYAFPFALGVGEAITIPVTYNPTSKTDLLDTIRLRNNAGTDNVIVLRSVHFDAPKFDITMDTIETIMYADSIGATVQRSFTISNIGTATGSYGIELSSGKYFKAYKTSGTATPSLAPGETDTIIVEFTAGVEELVQDSMTIMLSSTVRGERYNYLLQGMVAPKPMVRLFVEDIKGAPGSSQNLVVRLQSNLPTNIAKAQMTLVFNASVLVPSFTLESDNTENGIRTVVTTVDVTNYSNGEVLAALPFTITLGDQTESPVKITTVQWSDANGTTLAIPTTTSDATTSVDDDRIVNANGNGMYVTVQPNPPVNSINAVVHGIQGAVVLDLYTSTGNTVLRQNAVVTENQVVTMPLSNLAPGSYTLRVSSGLQTSVCRIVVQ